MIAYVAGAWKTQDRLRFSALSLTLWALTAFLLLPHLGYPRAIVFDETYMIPRAQRYMTGIFFQESHPPLGRLAILLGQYLLHPNLHHTEFALDETITRSWPSGEDMTGYRLLPAIFGTTIPVLVFLILRSVSCDELIAFLLSLAVSFDNALLTQARFALSDSLLISLSLLSILFATRLHAKEEQAGRKLWFLWVAWGVVSAAAMLVKFTAAFILVLVLLYAVKLLKADQNRATIIFAAAFGVAFFATTVAIWGLHFSLIPRLDPNNDYEISAAHRQILEGEYNPNPVARFWIEFSDALIFIQKYHKGVPRLNLAKPNEIGSPWYQWPFGGRTIPYRWETPDGYTYRYIYLIGNPATWLISLLGVIFSTAVTLSDALFRYLPAHRRKWIYGVALLYWTYMIPMMFIQRVMYLYHYLPALLLGIIAFGILLNDLPAMDWRVRRGVLLLLLTGVLVGFYVYKPFTYYEPLTASQFQERNIWLPWDLRCVNC